MAKEGFVAGIVAGVALSAVFAVAAFKTGKVVMPVNPVIVSPEKAYCHRTGLTSFEVIDTQFPDQPIYKLEGHLTNGGRTIEGSPTEASGKDAFNTFMFASPRLDFCQAEFTPPADYKHPIATRYTLK